MDILVSGDSKWITSYIVENEIRLDLDHRKCSLSTGDNVNWTLSGFIETSQRPVDFSSPPGNRSPISGIPMDLVHP